MTKPAITKRQVKGTPLTYSELDTNFQNLRDATVTLQAGTGGTSVVSDLNGTITLVAGTGIVLSGDNTAKTVTLSTTESQNIFQNIAVSGQSTVSADAASDTLTLVAGSNITITTNATTDTITFASTGGGELISDTTPQLGGNLDLNDFKITNDTGDVVIETTGFSDILLKSDTVRVGNAASAQVLALEGEDLVLGVLDTTPGASYVGTVTVETGANGNIVLNPDGSGQIKLEATTVNISTGSSSSLITTPGTGGITIRPNSNTGAQITVQASSTAGNVSMTPSGTGIINLNGPVAVAATSGTPTTFENGYYEDMLMTPISWLKVDIGGSYYYIPLFQ
jgi:hypothetical protein